MDEREVTWELQISTWGIEPPWTQVEIDSFCNAIDTAIDYNWFGPESKTTIIKCDIEKRHIPVKYGKKCNITKVEIEIEGKGDMQDFVDYLKKCWKTPPKISFRTVTIERKEGDINFIFSKYGELTF